MLPLQSIVENSPARPLHGPPHHARPISSMPWKNGGGMTTRSRRIPDAALETFGGASASPRSIARTVLALPGRRSQDRIARRPGNATLRQGPRRTDADAVRALYVLRRRRDRLPARRRGRFAISTRCFDAARRGRRRGSRRATPARGFPARLRCGRRARVRDRPASPIRLDAATPCSSSGTGRGAAARDPSARRRSASRSPCASNVA